MRSLQQGSAAFAQLQNRLGKDRDVGANRTPFGHKRQFLEGAREQVAAAAGNAGKRLTGDDARWDAYGKLGAAVHLLRDAR